MDVVDGRELPSFGTLGVVDIHVASIRNKAEKGQREVGVVRSSDARLDIDAYFSLFYIVTILFLHLVQGYQHLLTV